MESESSVTVCTYGVCLFPMYVHVRVCVVCIWCASIPASSAEAKHWHWSGCADNLAGHFSLLVILRILYIWRQFLMFLIFTYGWGTICLLFFCYRDTISILDNGRWRKKCWLTNQGKHCFWIMQCLQQHQHLSCYRPSEGSTGWREA